MAQTSYATEASASFAGMKADAGFSLTESGIARTAMGFGLAVGNEPGETNEVHIPLRDKGTITIDADFSADNVITVTVNGVACAPVTFTSAHATTATALLAAISANAQVTGASKSTNGRVYTIESIGSVINLNMTISGGTFAGSAPAYDYVTPQDDIFRGVALHQNNEIGSYAVNDAVSILRKGVVWVQTSGTVTADDVAYVDLAGGLGKFTSTSTNNMATGGKFRSSVTGAGLAKIEINLP